MEFQFSGRADQCVLKRFGHVGIMDEERMGKRVMISGVGVGIDQGWDR